VKVALYVHCFFPDHFYGTEAYTLALAKGLQARGHEPTIVAAVFDGEPPQRELIERRVWEGVPVISIDKTRCADAACATLTIIRPWRRSTSGSCSNCSRTLSTSAIWSTIPRRLLDVLRALAIPTVATLTDFFGFCFTNKLETADGSLCAGPDPRG